MDAFFDTVASADPRLVLVALVFHLSNFGLRSLAWRSVLRAAYPDRPVPLLGIAGAYAAGVAVNSFTPARGGDLAKIGLARTRIKDSSVPTIASSMGVVAALDAVVGVCVVLTLGALGALPSPPGLPSLPGAPSFGPVHVVGLAAVAALGACGLLLGRRLASRLLGVWRNLKAGASILASPRRYATEVVPVQLGAWACRIGAAYFLLAAMHLPATVTAAAVVVVVGGISTMVPTPGGVGTQQVLLAYALHTTASTAAVVSFSVGMQAAVTSLNLVIGLTAAMVMLRTFRPVAAVRGLRSAST